MYVNSCFKLSFQFERNRFRIAFASVRYNTIKKDKALLGFKCSV